MTAAGLSPNAVVHTDEHAPMIEHGKTLAMVVGNQLPIDGIAHHQPDTASDSGYTILHADAPHASELTDNDERVHWICLACLIDDNPEIGRGLDLARRHGTADLVDGEWIAGEPEDS